MSMLAEPRIRKRYVLQPKGKALYEDDNRFGTKMLQKMGWSKGKGLGAKENGEQDFVRVRFRNSNDGLGYEERDDQWTQHETGFNELLKNLNGSENPKIEESTAVSSDDECSTQRVGFGFGAEQKSMESESLKEKLSGQSLEEKSKKSRARVHYHKFTKGKDLTKYSEKDLANILGKKHDSSQEKKDSEVKPEAESTHQEQQFKSSVMDLNEYFKNKMKSQKNKGQSSNSAMESESLTNPEPEIKAKKEKSLKRKREEITPEPENETNGDCVNTELLKKKRKTSAEAVSGKEAQSCEEVCDNKNSPELQYEELTVHASDTKEEETQTVKKKKQKKSKKEKTKQQTEPLENAKPDGSATVEPPAKLSTVETEATPSNDDVFRISAFCAEKFRCINLDSFVGANIREINGYSMTENTKLEIQTSEDDEKRILQFWGGDINKYSNKGKRKIYSKYLQKMSAAIKNKQKMPRFNVQAWKRKSAFQAI